MNIKIKFNLINITKKQKINKNNQKTLAKKTITVYNLIIK